MYGNNKKKRRRNKEFKVENCYNWGIIKIQIKTKTRIIENDKLAESRPCGLESRTQHVELFIKANKLRFVNGETW